MATDDKKHSGTLYFYFAKKFKFISHKFAGPTAVIVRTDKTVGLECLKFFCIVPNSFQLLI